MKTYVLAAALSVAVLGAVVWGQGAGMPTATTTASTTALPTSAPASTMTDKQKIGYTIGLQIGVNFPKGIDIDIAALTDGLKDAMKGNKPQISEKEMDDAMTALKKQMIAAKIAAVAENQKAGEAFLAENGKKEGVKTTASGLQYKVIKSGTGKTPKATDTVSVKYRGTLISGKEFDASGDKTVEFQADGVIPGWTEALQLMKEGDKWMLYIPSKLAYGERGAGGDIGPNEALIFEVELVTVK